VVWGSTRVVGGNVGFLSSREEQSCYNFEEHVVPKEERTPLHSPPSQPKMRPQCKSRSSKSTATAQEEDSTTTQEKPLATMEEDTPDSIPRRSHSAANIDETSPQKNERRPLNIAMREDSLKILPLKSPSL